jgi:hypothetical protein
MPGLREVEKLLPALSRNEKAQLLKWVVRDLGDDFPESIRSRMCAEESPVWFALVFPSGFEQARRLGTTENQLLEAIRRCARRIWRMPGRS